jgi:hypothetical protein
MKRFACAALAAVLSALFVTGCVNAGAHRSAAAVRVNVSASTADAVDRLLNSMSSPLSPTTTVLVASFADLNDLTVSSKLGRLIAEESARHLIERGYRVPEIRLTNTLHIREDGEFMLSHEIDDLKIKFGTSASVVLSGTVTSVGGMTYVNFRMIGLNDGIALAASELELPDSVADR